MRPFGIVPAAMLATILAIIPIGSVSLPSTAIAADDLTGVWATDGTACDKLFVRNAKGIAFRDKSEIHGGGFIIEGSRIRGKAVTCTIKSRRVDGEVVHMLASCASDIMLSSVQFSVRLPSPDTLVRVFPGMSGMEMSYHRCAM